METDLYRSNHIRREWKREDLVPTKLTMPSLRFEEILSPCCPLDRTTCIAATYADTSLSSHSVVGCIVPRPDRTKQQPADNNRRSGSKPGTFFGQRCWLVPYTRRFSVNFSPPQIEDKERKKRIVVLFLVENHLRRQT